jgi:hypothetical protein
MFSEKEKHMNKKKKEVRLQPNLFCLLIQTRSNKPSAV